MNYDVPFIGNTPDDRHCLQASYAMIREYFEPSLAIDWDEWSELTGFIPGKGTWSMAGLMWFQENGYEVVHISTFDYREFSRRGSEYLLEALGEHIGRWESDFIIDLPLEQARAMRFAASGVWIQREPTLEDIYSYLDKGFLVKCLVNMRALNNEYGYLGHAVVVKGYTESGLILHDPGLPPQPNRYVSTEQFLKSWTNAITNSEKLEAIRKVSPVLDGPVEPPATPNIPYDTQSVII